MIGLNLRQMKFLFLISVLCHEHNILKMPCQVDDY